MRLKEEVIHDLECFDQEDLKEIVEFVSFLKFRNRHKAIRELDETKMGALYSKFAGKDSELAEQGMSDYDEGLIKENAR